MKQFMTGRSGGMHDKHGTRWATFKYGSRNTLRAATNSKRKVAVFVPPGTGRGQRRLARALLWAVCWWLCGATACPAGETTGEWQLVRRVGEVELYRRPVEGSDIPALRGHARFPAPIGAVFRVVSDYDHFAGFIPLVGESRVVRREAGITWVYQRLVLPLWFTDRHYVIRVVDDRHAPASNIIDIGWQLDEKRSLALTANDALLPGTFSGSWHLETIAGQAGCDAVYTLHVDPGGAVPTWLFVRLTGNYVLQVMNAVRERVAVDSR